MMLGDVNQDGFSVSRETARSGVSVELAPNYILFLVTRRQRLGFGMCVWVGDAWNTMLYPCLKHQPEKAFKDSFQFHTLLTIFKALLWQCLCQAHCFNPNDVCRRSHKDIYKQPNTSN